jgi:hypothetical protein
VYLEDTCLLTYLLTNLLRIEPTKRKRTSYLTEEEEKAQNEKEKLKEKELVRIYIHYILPFIF